MAKLSRRDFIKNSLWGTVSLALSQVITACSKALPQTSAPTATSQPASPTSPLSKATDTQAPAGTSASSPQALATEPASTAAATEAPLPDVVVTRKGQPEALVRQAIAALGGMDKFVSKGANVIIKPNICVAYSYEFGATTNPWVVGTLVKMCVESGAASVKVMDYPFGTSAETGYVTSGIQEQVEAAGGEMAYMTPAFKYVKTAIPNGIDLKEIAVFEDILKADVLINVPVAKNHSSTVLTLGMKNLMGVILDRNTMHINLGQRIADLASLVRPTLNVIDAVRIMTANGPSGGGDLKNVKEMDTVIVSRDIVAADSYATTLFGLKPDDIAYIKAGAAMGLGQNDLAKLNIKEIDLSS